MKLVLHVDQPLNGRTFGPGETVRGHVDLTEDANNTTAPTEHEVTLVFKGTIRVTIVPQVSLDAIVKTADSGCRREHTYMLFERTLTVAAKRVDDGLSHAPFRLAFPDTVDPGCCDGRRFDPDCTLPPSGDLAVVRIESRVVYQLAATARRPKHGALQLPWRRHLHASQKLAFNPPPPANRSETLGANETSPSTSSASGRHSLVCASSLLPCAPQSCKAALLQPADSPPPYSPAMALELVMPQPAVIAPGPHGIPLSIFLHTPSYMLAANGATLRSVRVTLHRNNSGRVGSAVAYAPQVSWMLWSIDGVFPLRKERLNITASCAAAWASDCRVPRYARPSFKSCFLSQTYTIQVDVGVSPSPTSKDIKHITSAMAVSVAEPPPDYAAPPKEAPAYSPTDNGEICPPIAHPANSASILVEA